MKLCRVAYVEMFSWIFIRIGGFRTKSWHYSVPQYEEHCYVKHIFFSRWRARWRYIKSIQVEIIWYAFDVPEIYEISWT